MKKQRASQQEYEALQRYREYYASLPIDPNLVILEARNGRTIDGNIYYLLRELMTNPAYLHLNVYLVAFDPSAMDAIMLKISPFADNRLHLVLLETDEYYRIMASAKYIINDSAIRNFYIKKDGQLYLNVWHGTPLKTMGRRVSHEPHATGSVQKNFIIADYLLYPSNYMMEHMIEDYMISDLSKATILMGGYPRNIAFFDDEQRQAIREKLGLIEKKVYAYLPTWRPEQMDGSLEEILTEIDASLQEDEILFVNVHPLAEEAVDFVGFHSVRTFPSEYETYAFLNTADALITDYSSVFYDFAVTKRNIVLFTYDEEEYFRTRGLYEPISSLPFPQVKTVDALIHTLRNGKTYDESAFLQKYCPYENPDAVKILCQRFFSDKHCMEERSIPCNGNEIALIYGGNLAPGRRTDAVMAFLRDCSVSETNYYLVFNRREVKNHKEILLHLPEGIRYYGRTGKLILSPSQEKAARQYKKGRLTFTEYWNAVQPAFAIERLRYFGNARIDRVIEIPPGPGITESASEMELELYSYEGILHADLNLTD